MRRVNGKRRVTGYTEENGLQREEEPRNLRYLQATNKK